MRDAIDSNTTIQIKKRKNATPIVLTQNERRVISRILGKDYSNCRIISHNFFDGDGDTIYFETQNLKYSEAYAGRGEFAVVKLIHKIENTSNYSLVILDEPEVSLHPGAQEELKIYLLESILRKKLQVVISTHAPKFVEFLPENAIKLFYENANGQFEVKNECHFIEAFQNIGIDIQDTEKSNIIVEDLTEKMILDEVIKSLDHIFELTFNVVYYPGGSTEMLKKGATYSEEKENFKFLLLDGDKQKPKPNPNEFTTAQSQNIDFIKDCIKKLTDIEFDKIGFRINGNSQGGNNENKISSGINYLNFLWTNLEFLPESLPEDIIWNINYVNKLLEARSIAAPNFNGNSKEKVKKFSELFFGDSSHEYIKSASKLLITEFINQKDENYNIIVKILNKFKSVRFQM